MMHCLLCKANEMGWNVNLNAAYDYIEIDKSCIIYLLLSSIQFTSWFKFAFQKIEYLYQYAFLSLDSAGFEILFLYVIDLDNIVKEYIHFTDENLIKMIV